MADAVGVGLKQIVWRDAARDTVTAAGARCMNVSHGAARDTVTAVTAGVVEVSGAGPHLWRGGLPGSQGLSPAS